MIDVILPVYNAAATIASSIDSVLAQTFADFRLIVVDDGSTDGTADILLADYGRRDSRITVISKQNSGIVDALNLGIASSDAEFIARQDADDLSLPLRFETQLRYLRDNEHILAVGCGFFDLSPEGKLIGVNRSLRDPHTYDPTSYPALEPYLPHPFLMMRRSAFDAVGGYRYMFHSEDADLYWRLMLLGQLHNLPIVLGAYRNHSQSVSGGSLTNGRVQTIYSQLAAISFRRRCEGRPDLDFDRGRLELLRAAPDHAAMCRVFDDLLDKEEQDYLVKASSMKLLEAASFRPYSIEADDVERVIDIYWFLSQRDRGAAHYARRLVKTLIRNPRSSLSEADRSRLEWKAFRTFKLGRWQRKLGFR